MEGSERAPGRPLGVGPWPGLPGAIAVALLVGLGGAGASMSGAGFALGVPGWPVLFLALAAGVLVFRSSFGVSSGLLIVPLVTALAIVFQGVPGLRLFSGPPLFAFAFAGVVLALASRRIHPPRWALLPVFIAIYSFVAWQARTHVGPDGDEPQYLMVAESLVRDHDFALDQDFAEARYSAFYDRKLEPHFRIRGPQGQVYSLHAVGLALLILPAYALAGYAGASVFMAVLAAFFVREVRRLVRAVSGDHSLAEGVAWLVGLTPPVLHFAGLIFTEIPAAFLVCVGLRVAVFGRGRRGMVVAALCAAALPWFNVRYGILSVAIAVAIAGRVWNERREAGFGHRVLVPGLVAIVSAVALSLFHHALWGFFDPRRVYGRKREFSLAILPEGLPGLFFDQEFGLFVYAPIYALAIAGAVALWRRQRVLALAGALAFGGVVLTASVWPMWRGGFNPPARFLVPLVPVLAAALALALSRGMRASTALLAGWSLWCGLGGAMNIETVHRDRDGVAPFLRTQSGAREWTAALPSFVLEEDKATRVLMWPWLLLLAIPVAGSLRRSSESGATGDVPQKPATARTVAAAGLAFVATALVADALSPRVRAPERDAVRLAGRAALRLPSFRFEAASAAQWPLDLFYEPHRHPEGVPIARAVSLGAGTWEVAIAAESQAAPPTLVMVAHGKDRPSRQVMTARAADQASGFGPAAKASERSTTWFTATIAVPAAGEFDLSLQGGEPTSLRAVRIAPLR